MKTRAIALRSDAADLGALHVLDGTLRATDERRRELLANPPAALTVEALVYRQEDGKPNRRFLRHATSALPTLAASYVGMPVLVDHNTYEQSARIGTIRSCRLQRDGNAHVLAMTLEIVKAEAIRSVLDGTLDRFSIGWTRTGSEASVICTAHRTPALGRGACACWPGDEVLIDGVARVAEFEFQSAEGTEVSAVNVPAVKGTGVREIRAALALELGADPDTFEKPTHDVGDEELTAQMIRTAEDLGADPAQVLANARAFGLPVGSLSTPAARSVPLRDQALDRELQRLAESCGTDLDELRADARRFYGDDR